MLNLYANIDARYMNAMEFLHLEKHDIVHYHIVCEDKRAAAHEFDAFFQKTLDGSTNYINIISTYEYTKYKNGLSHFVFVYAVTPVAIKDKNEDTGEMLAYSENLDLDSIEDYEPMPDFLKERIKEAMETAKASIDDTDDSNVIHIKNQYDMQIKSDEIGENIENALNGSGVFKPISFKLTDEQILKHTEAERDFYRAAYIALSRVHGVNGEEV